MSASVRLDQDRKGTLHITFTCARCGDKQSRLFQRARPRDIYYCRCGVTAALTPRVFAQLRDQAQRADLERDDFLLSF